jgi:hypothetical protein
VRHVITTATQVRAGDQAAGRAKLRQERIVTGSLGLLFITGAGTQRPLERMGDREVRGIGEPGNIHMTGTIRRDSVGLIGPGPANIGAEREVLASRVKSSNEGIVAPPTFLQRMDCGEVARVGDAGDGNARPG